MTTTTAQEYGSNFRVKRQWFSILQITMYTTGAVLSLLLMNVLQSATLLVVAPIFWLLAAPLGKYGRMLLFSPLYMARRLRRKRRKGVESRMSPDSSPVNGKVPKDGFRAAFHGSLIYRQDDTDQTDVLPLLMDGAKQRGALIVTAKGLKVGAGGDAETRLATAEIIRNGIRDTVNAYPGNLTIASIRVKRPGDVHEGLSYVTEEMADEVRDAPPGDPNVNPRQYALDQAWSGVFEDMRRMWVVSGDLGAFKGRVGETLYSPASSKKLLTSGTVFTHPLWQAAETLEATLLGVQAESPMIADAADQALLVGECFTTHPDDLESHYRRQQADLKAIREAGGIDLIDSMSARRGPFPLSVQTGSDWLLTGRTFHRILHILGGRGDVLPLGIADRFMAGARYSVLWSTVSSSVPGRWERYKAEERARVEETLHDTRAQGYRNPPARLEHGLQQATSERDDTWRSQAPPQDISNGVIISAVSLQDLNRIESQARSELNQLRLDVETVTGELEQVPWFLYFLGITKL